jgi:AcrR family transcriptional regulator
VDSGWQGPNRTGSAAARLVSIAEVASKPKRADAARNRERVLAAARAVFADRGTEASVPEIAERAGVGVATIYRSFPTKRDLVVAIVLERFRAMKEFTDAALAADRDPWDAFATVLLSNARMQLHDRAFGEVMAEAFDVAEVQAERDQLLDRIGELIRRAQHAGAMRRDVVAEDLPCLLSGLSGSLSMADRSSDFWQRHLAIVLDGLRADGAHPLPSGPPDRAALERLAAAKRRSC